MGVLFHWISFHFIGGILFPMARLRTQSSKGVKTLQRQLTLLNFPLRWPPPITISFSLPVLSLQYSLRARLNEDASGISTLLSGRT